MADLPEPTVIAAVLAAMTELVAVGFIYIDAMPEQAGEGLAGAMRELNRRSAAGNAAR